MDECHSHGLNVTHLNFVFPQVIFYRIHRGRKRTVNRTRNEARPDSLTSFRTFTSSACHFKFSHHIPLLCCRSPSTVRGFLAVTTRPLWQKQPSCQASCISWHNVPRAMWQLKATLPSSQSSRKRDIFAPDWSCSITFGARPSTWCSHCSGEEVPSLSVHDSKSLSQSRRSGQPYLHMSPRSGD